MRQLVLASNNPGKITEMRAMLADLNIELIPQADFGVDDIAETGLSFVENALLKARHAATVSGLPSLADDSGLEVDALNGSPGIHTARYAGVGASSSDIINKLLSNLRDVPLAQRTARGRCVLTLLRHAKDATPLIFQGTWEGRILLSPRGNNGFGFDQIFEVLTHHCSAAELSSQEKNRISHRGQALAQLIHYLTLRERHA